MALSMDEQRMLAEIEQRLAAADPRLASDLTSFRKPGRLNVLRSTRARVIGSLFTVVVVAMVSLMVYAMLPFRSGARTTGNHPVTTSSASNVQGQAEIGAQPGTSSPGKNATAKTSASARTSASAKASASNASAHAASKPAAAQSGTSASAAGSP
jgi:cytoskeletal protein RodZ